MKLYYGNETKKAMQAFDFSSRSVDKEFIYSITQIKKASCIANFKTGRIDKKMMSAILKVSDEILLGKLENNFKLKYLQGGAGTAINMNVNEVIAKKGTEILKNEINPNDHVNISQSTNDVNPSATKITLVNLNKKLIYSLDLLINSLDKKSKEFKNIKKLGRTHLQDAIPTTLGLEFSSYKEIVLSHKKNILNTSKNLYELNMGGTAIGDQTNADFKYKEYFYKELNKITKENFRPAKNLMSKTSSQSDILFYSQSITALCASLSKIANDLRFMSSGPKGGLQEIVLPEVLKGSSIMPGKVNPVYPETINQLYFVISGNNLTIEKSEEAGQMELNVMGPTITNKIIETTKLVSEVLGSFSKNCVSKIKANKEKCLEHLENSTALSTKLMKKLKYGEIEKIVKKSLEEKISFKEACIKSGLLNEKEFNKLTK